MTLEPRIVWHGLDPSEAVNDRIRHEVASLEKFYGHITACRVAMEKPHQHQRNGAHFVVKIELVVPGKVLVVDRDPPEKKGHEDPLAAVNEAFGQMSRQLEDYIRVRRGA